MKVYKVNDKSVVLILTKPMARFLQRGIADGYMQNTVLKSRIVERLVDALDAVGAGTQKALETKAKVG